MVQDRAMANQQKVMYGLSNGIIFNDPEQPLTQFSRSSHSLMLDTLRYGHSYYKLQIENPMQTFE